MPMNLTRKTIVLLFAAIAAFGCGGGGTGATGSTSTAAAGGSIAEDLTFTGALAGHMGSAQRGDTYVCAGTGGSYVAGPIVGSVGGKQVSLNITKISFKGAGSYAAGGVGFDTGSDHYFPATATQSTLVVNTDLRSGTVNIDLAVNSDPNTVVGHVSGTWRCPPDQF